MRRSLALICALCLLSATSAAWAEPATEDAHGRFKQGLAAIEAKNWQRALEVLSDLWREKRSYDVALLLGQVELNLKKYRDAAEHLDFGVRNAAAREAPANLARATQLLELAKKHVGTLEIRVNRDAGIRVDGESIEGTSPEANVFVEPGFHTLEAVATGFEPAAEQLRIDAGESRQVELVLRDRLSGVGHATTSSSGPTLTPPPARPDDSLAALKWPVVIGTGALAIAGLGIGTYFLVRKGELEGTSADLRGDLPADSCTGTSSSVCNDLRTVKSDGRQAEQLAWGGLAAGGVLAVGTAVAWWLWPDPAPQESHAVRLTPLATPAGHVGTTWGGALTGTF